MSGLDIIITGIPRSGTSYLCGLLDKVKNNVVINEPDRMSILLSEGAEPIAAANFYKSIRKSILSGEKIKNKMNSGKIIEDTAVLQNFEMYLPEYEDENFTLCTKNTLGYLSRLDKFEKVMPDSPIFACIRNPIDTIASWKTTFDHLKMASVATNFFIGSKNDIYLTAWQKTHLDIISKEESVARRRALFWSYLAEWIAINRGILTIINYDDIVLFPEKVLETVFDKIGVDDRIELKEAVKSSLVRTGKREFLDSDDYEAIEEICFPLVEKMELFNV
jgi:hypothetical protein